MAENSNADRSADQHKDGAKQQAERAPLQKSPKFRQGRRPRDLTTFPPHPKIHRAADCLFRTSSP